MKKFILFTLAACTTLFAQEPAQEATAAPVAETATVATTANEAVTAPETVAASPAANTVTESATVAASAESAAKTAPDSAATTSATITDTGNAQADEANTQEVAILTITEAKPQLVSRRNTQSVLASSSEARKQDKPAEECILCNEVQNAIGDSLGKKWRHLIGAAFTVPITQYKINKEKINLVNLGINLSYMGMSRFGFTTRATISAGATMTDDIKFEGEDDSPVGSYGALELGVGMSFVNNAFFTFAMYAMVGIEYATFETDENAYDHEELGTVDRSFSETVAALTLGGDIVARIAFTEHVGVFVSVGGRWVASTASETVFKYRKGDYTRTESYLDDGRGNFSIVPTLGVMWRF